MAYTIITLTAQNGVISNVTGTGVPFESDGVGLLRVNEDSGNATVEVTPNEGYAFHHIEVDGDNLGDEYVLVDAGSGIATFHIRGCNVDAGENYYGDNIVAVCEELATQEPAAEEAVFGNPIRVITASGYYSWNGEDQNNVTIVGLVTDKVEDITIPSRESDNGITISANVVEVIQHDGCGLNSNKAYVTNVETTDPSEMYAYYYAEPESNKPDNVNSILGGPQHDAIYSNEPTIVITNSPYNEGSNDDNGGNDNPSDPSAPDEPTPTPPDDGGDQTQCTEPVIEYISARGDFNEIYQKALLDYDDYVIAGSPDFANWFIQNFWGGGDDLDTDYINGLLSDGYTHLDILTVGEYAKNYSHRGDSGFIWAFTSIYNNSLTYDRRVSIDLEEVVPNGKGEIKLKWHMKGGFTGEKAMIDGNECYVVNLLEDYSTHTREGETERNEPSIGGNFGYVVYFKSRVTENLDDVFVGYGIGMSIGLLLKAEGVKVASCEIEYEGGTITPAELVAQKVDEYSARMSSMMSRLSAVLTERNGLRKAGKVLSSMDIAYKSMVDSIRDMLQ